MRHRWLFTATLAFGTLAPAQAAPAPPSTTVYIGTQGAAILRAYLDRTTGALAIDGPVANIVRPTWLALDPKRPFLFSVSEQGNDGKSHGQVCSFAIAPAPAPLRPLNCVDSGGGGATFVSYDPASATAFVGNFGGGQVGAFPVHADGTLSPASSIGTDTGAGVSAKQEQPHAHAAILDPGGHFVLTPDMGTDRVFVRRFEAKTRTLIDASPAFEATPPGTGPRHLTFSKDGHFLFVLTELSAEIRAYRWDGRTGRMTLLHIIQMDGPDFQGTHSAAEIDTSADGRFLYASNRTRSSLLVYALSRKSGDLRLVQDIPSGGKRPRSFGIDPSGRWLIVGNQDSQTIASFSIDRASGKLAQVGNAIPVAAKPVSFVFSER